MSRIKERIEKLYKTLGLTALMAVPQHVNAASVQQNECNGQLSNSELLTEHTQDSMDVAESDTISDKKVCLKDIDFDPSFIFSAEILDSLETSKDGRLLASKAKIAQRKVNDESHCYRAFKLAAKLSGLGNFEGESAWMAAEQLAENPNFVEIKCDKRDFEFLPDGAVIVYGKGKVQATKNGHIGTIVEHRDFSSKKRNINQSNTKRDRRTKKRVPYGGEPRVFLPADTVISYSVISEYILRQENSQSTLNWDNAVKLVQNNQNTY